MRPFKNFRRLPRFARPLRRPRRRGFALVSAAVLLGLVMAFGFILIDTTLSSRRASRTVQEGLTAEQIAEAGLHKAIYCMKATSGTYCGGSYGTGYVGETNVSFGGGTFTTTITSVGIDRKVVSEGKTAAGRTARVATNMTTTPPTAPASFNFAVQVSDQGISMSNNAEINNGDIWSDSNILCNNNAETNRDIYVSLPGGRIDNCDVGRDAHADQVLLSKVIRDAHFKNDPADVLGTTVGGAKYPNSPTPGSQAMPTVDINYWRQRAEEGGTIVGDHFPADGSILGPKKITGNLTLFNNVDITLNGPVWVEGTITLENNASISLATSYLSTSTVLLADNAFEPLSKGKIILYNNAALWGSGQDGSYIVAVSTNTSLLDTAPAIRLENNASGNAIYLATNGVVRMYNNAGAVAVAGRRVSMENNAVIDYDDTGLTPANIQLSATPSNIWLFRPGTWREIK